MKSNNRVRLRVDKKGRLELPKELVSSYGIRQEEWVYLDIRPDGVYLCLPAHLQKLYIEPTTRCNLNCRTCIRHSWDEPMGMMPETVFDRIMDGLEAFSQKPTVFFGGFGEPLSHPGILEMVRRAKSLGSPVELITNGTLLTRELSQELVDAELDVLWVSLDGASPESYADVRLGATLPLVLENLGHFRSAVESRYTVSDCGVFPASAAVLGIAFVAMKHNINDLPEVLNLARRFGAKRFLMTNVLPHTEAMREEILYDLTLQGDALVNPVLSMSIPRLDATEETHDPVYRSMRMGSITHLAGSDLNSATGRCPFIQNGAGAVGWDGGFSPCLSLLHSHTSYLPERERYSKRWIIGNVADRDLYDLWNDPEHLDFRRKVQIFDFPPCTVCGGCEMADKNEDDCWGSGFPACGGCLWAQGFIQCP